MKIFCPYKMKSLNFGVFVLFWAYMLPCACVILSATTKIKIKRAICSFDESVSRQRTGALLVKEWPVSQSKDGTDECKIVVDWYTSPAILLWDVFSNHPEVISTIFCPFCLRNGARNRLQRSGKWADTSWSSSAYEPRMIFDSSGVLLLVSHIYVCSLSHQVPSHHPSIISVLPSSVYVPFFLTHRAGFTVDMLTEISSMVDAGLSFTSIENIIRDKYEQSYWRIKVLYEEDCSRCGHKCSSHQTFPNFEQNFFPFPHTTLIRSVFLSYSLLFDHIYYDDMTKRLSKWLACDHTFKSAANIGFTRKSDGRWIKVMKCVFCVLGTSGEILHWRFTRGESFSEVSGIFQELKTRHEKEHVVIEGIIIDNCCKWKGLLSQIFPGIVVKLDLFHAVQRFVSTLPMAVRRQTNICKEYGLVFRSSNDLGNQRTEPTPKKETLLNNLESFRNKWHSKLINGCCVLNPAAITAIANIKVHIEKDCLSNVPVHISTCANERLHRHLNSIMKTNKIGLDTAFVRCSRLFYRNNNKESRNCLTPSLTSVDFAKREEHFGFADFGQQNDEGLNIPTMLQVSEYKSLNELTTNVLCSIRESICSFIQNDCQHEDHTYIEESNNNILLSVALCSISFFEMYKGLDDIGATRLISKSDLPCSIGLQNTCASSLHQLGHLKQNVATSDSYVLPEVTLSGHLQGFGLEQVEINGDGNCFFSSVAFQVLNLLQSGSTSQHLIAHLANIGLTSHLSVQDVSIALRNLVVQEWMGDAAAEYANFLSDDVDYYTEVRQFQRSGVFQGPLGDLMPIAMANLLGIPLAIITSEPNNPLISICPNGNIVTPSPIFLAYISSGPGHYNAVASVSVQQSSADAGIQSEADKDGAKQEKNSNNRPKAMAGCRCDQRTKSSKTTKKYNSRKRCKCIVTFKKCSYKCKCSGSCGGKVCKSKVVKMTKNFAKVSPRAKHTLQKSKKKLRISEQLQEDHSFNFLEVCLLCAIIHFFQSGQITFESWDADGIYKIYTAVIDSLLAIGFIIPIRKLTKGSIWKKVEKMKKDFKGSK